MTGVSFLEFVSIKINKELLLFGKSLEVQDIALTIAQIVTTYSVENARSVIPVAIKAAFNPFIEGWT
jgi:hypothetical protein